MENELRRVKAELESRVRSEEERTVAAAAQARAQAEQELQRIRVELEAIRLEADRVLPADADRRRRELEAEGEAAAIRERGRAVAEALELLRSAWSEAGDAAPSILVIEDLEKHLRTAALGVAKVRVDRLRMLDGGDGRVLSGYLAAWPAMIRSVFRAVADTTGIDIPRLVAGEGKAPPAAAADAAGEAER
jgi:flotillin